MSDEGQVATTTFTASVAPNERRTAVITWFLGWGFVLLIFSYGSLAIYSLITTPVDGAWTIITNAQKDLKEILLIVVGVLGGAVTQKHQ